MKSRESVEAARSRLREGRHDRSAFHATLLRVPAQERDAWVDTMLGIDELPGDAPDLPRGCIPYLPSSVDTLLRVVERAPVQASDVFVDIGAGIGRAIALIHLLTGATAVGLEIQPELASAARRLAERLSLPRVTVVEGDAAEVTGVLDAGTVFFLYCPFGGERLTKVLADLERVARTRAICICCVDLPLPASAWLALGEEVPPGDLTIWHSVG